MHALVKCVCLARERVATREMSVHVCARSGIIHCFVLWLFRMFSVVYGSGLWLCRYVCVDARLTMYCMWRETATDLATCVCA